MHEAKFLGLIVTTGLLAWACSSDSPGTGGTGGSPGASGSSSSTAGTNSPSGGSANPTAGSSTTGGNAPSAGSTSTGGSSAGVGSGGAPNGGASTGGTPAGGTSTGGTPQTGPVTVQLGQAKQTIDGFGINNTWAPAMSDAEADALFSTTTGLGLSILRVGMSDSGGYMSDNISADITKAKARGVKYIIGSCWSPPGSMKTTGQVNNGGHVKPENYDAWATTIVKFAKDNGLYAMSIANEPDFASCGSAEPCNGEYPTTLYTDAEMVAFVKVAAPKFKAAGIKLIAPEASEWLHQWSNMSACCSEPGKKESSNPLKGMGYDYGHALYKDKDAWAGVDIMGVHQYDTQVAEVWPADVPEKKPVWQTEMSGVKWWPEQGPTSDIGNGVAVAGWVHDALTRGDANAWLWWWYRANNTDDNEGLLLKNGTDTKRHYTFGNYTRFIRPGYVRVDISGAIPADVLLSAYKGEDGTVVMVAINKGAADAMVPITVAGGTAPAMLTPWVTSATDNLVSKAAVAVAGGMFTAALPSKTVTTFVGK